MIRRLAPAFESTAVVDGQFEKVSLDQFRGKWVVLAFVPLAFTFVCPIEIVAFNEALPKFENRNAVVLFVSTDSEFTLNAWNGLATQQGGLGNVKIPLVSDKSFKISSSYGVLVPEEGIALRGTFLIDPRGVLVQKSINNTPVGRSVDEVLRLIDAFQFTEEHGEVCPANWTQGKPAINTSQPGTFFQTFSASK